MARVRIGGHACYFSTGGIIVRSSRSAVKRGTPERTRSRNNAITVSDRFPKKKKKGRGIGPADIRGTSYVS